MPHATHTHMPPRKSNARGKRAQREAETMVPV